VLYFHVPGLQALSVAALFMRSRGAPLLIRGTLGGVLVPVTPTAPVVLCVSVRSGEGGADGCRTGRGAVDARAWL
jgi:hypothetical protein